MSSLSAYRKEGEQGGGDEGTHSNIVSTFYMRLGELIAAAIHIQICPGFLV